MTLQVLQGGVNRHTVQELSLESIDTFYDENLGPRLLYTDIPVAEHCNIIDSYEINEFDDLIRVYKNLNIKSLNTTMMRFEIDKLQAVDNESNVISLLHTGFDKLTYYFSILNDLETSGSDIGCIVSGSKFVEYLDEINSDQTNNLIFGMTDCMNSSMLLYHKTTKGNTNIYFGKINYPDSVNDMTYYINYDFIDDDNIIDKYELDIDNCIGLSNFQIHGTVYFEDVLPVVQDYLNNFKIYNMSNGQVDIDNCEIPCIQLEDGWPLCLLLTPQMLIQLQNNFYNISNKTFEYDDNIDLISVPYIYLDTSLTIQDTIPKIVNNTLTKDIVLPRYIDNPNFKSLYGWKCVFDGLWKDFKYEVDENEVGRLDFRLTLNPNRIYYYGNSGSQYMPILKIKYVSTDLYHVSEYIESGFFEGDIMLGYCERLTLYADGTYAYDYNPSDDELPWKAVESAHTRSSPYLGNNKIILGLENTTDDSSEELLKNIDVKFYIRRRW
jgi:hypothetical protein